MKASQPALQQRIDNRADQPAEGDDEQHTGADFRDLFDLPACDDGVGNVAMKIGRGKSQRRPGTPEQRLLLGEAAPRRRICCGTGLFSSGWAYGLKPFCARRGALGALDELCWGLKSVGGWSL